MRTDHLLADLPPEVGMETRSIKALLVALVSGALGAACSPWLFTDVPIGEPVESLAPADWNGAWLDPNSGQGFWFRVAPKGGPLEFFWPTGDGEGSRLYACPDESNVKFEPFFPIERRYGEWFLDARKDRETGYYMYSGFLDLLLRNKNGSLIASDFSKAAVQKMTREGQLPGEVQPNGNVVLRGLQQEHLDKLIATAWAEEKFAVAARLPRELDPCHGTLTPGN
jgi:hypothetical protein